jgi:hypothetical protein
MTNTLQADIPSPFQIRDELEAMVIKDLLGPAGGPHEIVAEPTVRGRYILGVLAPRGQHTTLLDEDEDLDDQTDLPTAGDDTQDGTPDTNAAKAPSMLPSSIGLTFTVDGEAKAIRLTARWGRYERVENEAYDPAQKGTLRRVWQRIPVEGTSEPLPLVAGKFGPWTPDPDYDEVTVRGLLRHHDDHWTVTLYLTNDQVEPKSRSAKGRDSAWVFQPELIVEAADGSPIFIKRLPPRGRAGLDLEDQAMQMIYRHQVEFATGHGVAVHADLPEGSWDRAWRLSTRVMPTYDVPKTTPPTTVDIPELDNLVLDMKTLAETADADFAQVLGPLITAYRQWIDTQSARVAHPADDLKPFLEPAQQALERASSTLARIQAGIDLLGSDPQAAQAFRFANRAMWQQRLHTTYAQQRRQVQKVTVAEFDVPGNRRWYPFQLAFILLNLPSVTDIHHPDRSDPTRAIADLLWFPTGGGKTEAYLGLTAYTLGLRRLQGEVEGYSGAAGVAVLMRYTLRLLTLQQFQRATALICACEAIRREALAQGDPTWGVEPFRIGLWVGARSTPNWTDESAEAIKRDRGKYGGAFGGSGTPYQLTYCPWCGSDIGQGRDLVVETYGKGRGRTFIYCGDLLGRCLFSRKQSPDEGLPAVVVDEEIYRRLPALLIATVDKFAQMPWKGATQMLFGRVNGYCERHGFRSPEIEDADYHRAGGKLPKASTKPAGPLRPPDLIIQDELHLISGPLGTLVGLYESAIDYLCSWDAHGQRVRPKVIASTATIRRAEDQVNNLYLRKVNIFPPAGLDVADNFFSRQRPPDLDQPGRRYVGICAPGTRLKTVLIRVYVAYMAAAQQLYERYGAAVDPYLTLIGYFNSMRELGGMRRAVDDAIRTRLRKTDERGLARRFIEHFTVEELTSRKGAGDIPAILDQLENPFPAQAGQKPPGDKRPLDVLLATNMISVGVDVSRLGLMVVAGQPKTTAEYIQATSRVGRRHPGLVCVVYNWARPRDLSHYERFEHYHATFYQNVEPLSVTPFSARARNRGLSGVLVSYVRLAGEEFNDNLGAGRITNTHPFVQKALQDISWRAGMIEAKADVETEVRKELEDRLDQWLAQAQKPAPARLGYVAASDSVTLNLLYAPEDRPWDDFTCLNSLRDVEPSVGLILDDYGMEQKIMPVSYAGQEDDDPDE